MEVGAATGKHSQESIIKLRMNIRQNENKAIVLFDGVCNLCNTWVQRIIKNDAHDYFRFASLQSDIGKSILKQYQVSLPSNIESVILIESGKAYFYSTAALRIAGKLSGAYKLLYPLLIFPSVLRDGVYKLIARNRYRWWGKQESCMLPSEKLKSKFL
jgi:predicted DCC family thiol-disulfide oxidoreductase YuxK